MSFLRLAGAAAVLLSLGLFARALPMNLLGDINVHALAATDGVSCALNKLIEADIIGKINGCVHLDSLADVSVALNACIELIKACSDELLKIGATVTLDAKAKEDIVAFVAAIITLFVKVCLQLTLKFGVAAVARIFADIDLCIKLLLVNLNVCVDGIIALVLNALVSVTVGLMPQLNLAVCASLFASLGAVAGVSIGN
ncbi:unnamed protein product [Rhizoctonia solani]|uniref:Transmembrane protein n=1 Tax=Rhizoctonia solani TaxID=456999 RepID=A0A8H3GNW8_9AGAM|nr:unnamed protein product [Rhizoctonia solani]